MHGLCVRRDRLDLRRDGSVAVTNAVVNAGNYTLSETAARLATQPVPIRASNERGCSSSSGNSIALAQVTPRPAQSITTTSVLADPSQNGDK